MNTSWRWRHVVLAACLLAFGAAGTAVAADDKPADKGDRHKGGDKEIYEVLKDIHNRGADLYNNGDAAGCYRMFQGALMMVQPLLDHHPDLQKMIEDGLAKADTNASMGRRAFALHELIENVRGKIKPGAANVSGGKTSSERASGDKSEKPSGDKKPATKLWDQLGGETNVRKIVEDAVKLMANDPKVDFTRGGKYKLTEEDVIHLRKEIIDLISSATGGPYPYEGKTMKEAHKGMGVTDAQFDASVADLAAALKKNNVPPDAARKFLKMVEDTRKDIVEAKKSGGKEPQDENKPEKKPADKAND